MATARRDSNYVPVELATSNADGITPLLWQADPITHRLKMNIGITGSNTSPNHIAERDLNRVHTSLVVSNGDNVTPVQLYIDSNTNALLATTA